MKLAFALFEHVPFGGLQRDFRAVARECLSRGHDVCAFTRGSEGSLPEGLELIELPVGRATNVGRDAAFIARLGDELDRRRFDAVVGFNKMPRLDVYYAADPCHRARARSRGVLYRLSRRCRRRCAWERAVFSPSARTEVLLLAETEKHRFQSEYGTPDERFRLLPPNLARDELDRDAWPNARADLRRELGLGDDVAILLSVGSGFRIKGLERSVRALAALAAERRASTVLLVAGDDDERPFRRLARRLGVEDQVLFLGGRSDVARLYAASDLLLHPAHHENTGTVLLEAIVMGLPVLASASCGYAGRVRESGAGEVCGLPFDEQRYQTRIAEILADSGLRRAWAERARAYGERDELYRGHATAADLIERSARERAS